MYASMTGKSHLQDRFSWIWLALGLLLLPFAAFETVLPIAAWLAPIFLLRFVRTQRGRVGLSVVALAYAIGTIIGFRDILPPPTNYLVGLLSTTVVIAYALDRWLGARLSGVARTLVFPLTITLMDWILAFGPLGSGMTAGYSQYGNLPLMQLASVTGIWGITFLVAWLAPVANELWEHAADWRAARPAVALYTAVLLAVVLFGSARVAFAPNASSTLRVAGLTHDKALWASLTHGIVDVAQGADTLRGEMRTQYQLILDDLFGRTREQARAGAQLVMWSEVAAHILKEDEPTILERARTVARQEHIYLQVALDVILHAQQHPYAQNRVLLIDPAGTIIWDYYKTVHPFGDNAIFAPGPGVIPVVDTPYGRIATVICFDADYPALLRQVGQAGTDVLLVPSHDWEAVKHMHAQVAVFRAIENGVAMVRPTGDGISLATDYLGRVLATADDYVTTKPVMVVDAPRQGMFTIYAKVGDLFAYFCAAGWIVLVIAAVWRSHGSNAETVVDYAHAG